jgi:hypothetical protein
MADIPNEIPARLVSMLIDTALDEAPRDGTTVARDAIEALLGEPITPAVYFVAVHIARRRAQNARYLARKRSR